jgi:hypothetical protein
VVLSDFAPPLDFAGVHWTLLELTVTAGGGGWGEILLLPWFMVALIPVLNYFAPSFD